MEPRIRARTPATCGGVGPLPCTIFRGGLQYAADTPARVSRGNRFDSGWRRNALQLARLDSLRELLAQPRMLCRWTGRRLTRPGDRRRRLDASEPTASADSSRPGAWWRECSACPAVVAIVRVPPSAIRTHPIPGSIGESADHCVLPAGVQSAMPGNTARSYTPGARPWQRINAFRTRCASAPPAGSRCRCGAPAQQPPGAAPNGPRPSRPARPRRAAR